MTDESQVVVPPSFVALFIPPRQTRPTESRGTIAARYELCEDLALSLLEHPLLRVEDEADRGHAVVRILEALVADDAVVSRREAEWVVARLEELLRHGAP